jgi:hypothetical protein
MQTISRALGAILFLVHALAAQANEPGICTGLIPVPVPVRTDTFGQLTCAVGFAGMLGQPVNAQFQSATCPALLIITPPHSECGWRQGAMTDVRVGSQEPVHLVTFKCVGHYLLIIWLYDTCEVDQIKVIGHVDNYVPMPCRMEQPAAAPAPAPTPTPAPVPVKPGT